MKLTKLTLALLGVTEASTIGTMQDDDGHEVQVKDENRLSQLITSALAGAPPGAINEPTHADTDTEDQVQETQGETRNYRFRWQYACAFTKWVPSNQFLHSDQAYDATTMTLERFGFIGMQKKCFWGMTGAFWVTPLKIEQIVPNGAAHPPTLAPATAPTAPEQQRSAPPTQTTGLAGIDQEDVSIFEDQACYTIQADHQDATIGAQYLTREPQLNTLWISTAAPENEIVWKAHTGIDGTAGSFSLEYLTMPNNYMTIMDANRGDTGPAPMHTEMKASANVYKNYGYLAPRATAVAGAEGTDKPETYQSLMVEETVNGNDAAVSFSTNDYGRLFRYRNMYGSHQDYRIYDDENSWETYTSTREYLSDPAHSNTGAWLIKKLARCPTF